MDAILNANVVLMNSQKEPPEGRMGLAVNPMTFTDGSERFSFTTESLPGHRKPSGILTMWVDATQIEQGKNVLIKTDIVTIPVPGGRSGYIPVTSRTPFEMEVYSDDAATGTIVVRLFNFEVVSGESQTIQTIAGAVVANQGTANAVPWNENLTKVGGAEIALGQAAKAASLPVTIASDQGNIPENLAQVGGAAIALGQAAKAASLPVTIASDQGNIPENLAQVGGANITLGQKAMSASVPVVISSDQSTIPVNCKQFDGKTSAYSASHVTSNTTTTPVASTAYLYSLVLCVTGAGTAWTVVVKNKEATPKTIYSATLAVGTTVVLNLDCPVLMTSGIDIVTAGTAAGTLDVFTTYAQ
jgi:hypothetical protein